MGLEVHLGWMWVPGLLHTMVPLCRFGWMQVQGGSHLILNGQPKTSLSTPSSTSSPLTSLSRHVPTLWFPHRRHHRFQAPRYFQRRLAAIIEDGFVHVSLSKDTEDPQYVIHRIPMDRPQNVIAWWYLRACLQDWGLTYFRRISLYAGFFLVYVFILIAVAFVQMYFVERALETSVILYVTLHGAVLCGLLSIMIFFGERYNQNRRRAGLCLSQKKVELESEYSDITRRLRILSHHPQKLSMETMETRRAQLYDAVRSIETVMQTVQNDNGMNCIKILGFEAGDQLLQGVLTVAGFGVTAVLRRFL
ncbi:hypothetical protein BC829DRAFT_395484 [Chytridium lagenaria]|nr:hypothetical protein BC829DRAFT_395484 [Chytridium lagenaria]